MQATISVIIAPRFTSFTKYTIGYIRLPLKDNYLKKYTIPTETMRGDLMICSYVIKYFSLSSSLLHLKRARLPVKKLEKKNRSKNDLRLHSINTCIKK